MDKDLCFLTHCKNSELRKLCDILTHDKDGHLRLSESLTATHVYLENYPERMQALAPAVADELLRLGSNSISTIIRHNTPESYEAVVRRVCRQMKVKVGKYDNARMMEHALLESLCEASIRSMTIDELRSLAEEVGIPSKGLMKKALAAAMLVSMRINPGIFRRVAISVAYEFLSLVIGRGVALVGVRIVQRSVGVLFGPVGWIILTAWTAWDIASPAYRVCIPAIIQVALMRLSFEPEYKEGRNA